MESGRHSQPETGVIIVGKWDAVGQKEVDNAGNEESIREWSDLGGSVGR